MNEQELKRRSQPKEKRNTPAPASSPSGFITFFRGYVNAWVAAAVLLPTLLTWKGMPVYESQRSVLTTYTALSCVLILAFMFYARELLDLLITAQSRIALVARLTLPFLFIAGTVFFGYEYTRLLNDSAYYAQKPLATALKELSMDEIHDGTFLIASYILTVLFAECALFLMAFREWSPNERRH